MKLRNISPMGAIRTIVPTVPLSIIEADADGVVTVTKDQLLLVLNPYPNPHWEPADKQAEALAESINKEQ